MTLRAARIQYVDGLKQGWMDKDIPPIVNFHPPPYSTSSKKSLSSPSAPLPQPYFSIRPYITPGMCAFEIFDKYQNNVKISNMPKNKCKIEKNTCIFFACKYQGNSFWRPHIENRDISYIYIINPAWISCDYLWWMTEPLNENQFVFV